MQKNFVPTPHCIVPQSQLRLIGAARADREYSSAWQSPRAQCWHNNFGHALWILIPKNMAG